MPVRLTLREHEPDAARFYRRMGADDCGRARSGSLPGRMLPKLVKELRPPYRSGLSG